MAKRENIIRAYERAVEQLFSNKAAFADYLDFSGRFYKLPSSQTIMIYDDNPNAKMVAEYDTWQQFGRNIKPGGWSTDVLDNGKIKRFFDISMTKGDKVPYQWSLNKKTAEELTDRLSKSESREFTGMSDCIYHLAANAVNERFEDVANLLAIPEKDEDLFKKSFSSMVRRVIAARCEWNSEFTYGGTGAAKGVDLSALDMLDNSGDMETLLEEVQITAKNVLKSMEKSINDIIFERSIDNERNERVDRTRDRNTGRGGSSSVVRGGEDIYAVDNDAQRENVQARREDVSVQPDDGIVADERGARADGEPGKPLGESVADVYDGELSGGHSEAAGQTSVGSDSAQDRQGSVGDHGENTGGISVDEPTSNVGERVDLGGTVESSDRGTDNGVSGERSENGAVTSQSNENTLTAENNSAVNYLSIRIAELSDAFVQKYDGDYKDFTLANYAFSHTGAEYDLNLSVRENVAKMLRNGQYDYLKDYLNAVFKEAFEGRVITDEGLTAGEIIAQLSKLREPKSKKMSVHSEDGEQLRLFSEPLDKKQQAELDKLTEELTDEFASWEKQFIDGGSDAIYEDGVGLDLIRNHILHYKYELEEKFPNNLPEIYHRETPPEYPRTYQSVKKGDTLRFEYGDYLVLNIEKTNEYSGEYTVQLQDKNGEVITQSLREIKTKFQNLTNRGEVPSRADIIKDEADITNIPSDLDKFYVNRENERVTRVYYNPDSDAGGQLVYEHFTFDQIFDAMIKDDALEYLSEVSRQELVDVTANDFAAKAREFLADTEDFNSSDEGYLDKLGALAEPTYSILQLKDGENLRDFHFAGMAELRERGLYIDRENYNRVYRGRLNDGETLEDIYTRFNVDRPKDFYGHSLSVGDIIGIVRDSKPTAYYVDSAGFEEVPDFLLDLEERRARRTLTDNIELYAENMLASDEMDDLGDYLFDPNCTYDRGDLTIGDTNFPFDELRKLAERYKNGEDIRAELGRGMYAPRGEISYYGKYGYDFPNPKITVTRDESGMNFKTKGGFEIAYSWEQLGEAMITAAKKEYERHETLDRAAEITDIIEAVRKGKTAAITEKTEEQIAMVADARKKTFDNITLKFDNDRGFHLTADTANEHGAVITIFGANVQAVGEYLERNAEQIELTAPVIDRAEKKMTTDELMADFVPYNEKKVITAEKVGDFYEFYGDIAVELSEKFNLTLTQRNGKPMVGVPAYNFEDFCDEIFDKGYMVENDPAYQEIVKPHVTVIPSRARAEELIEEYYDREFGEFDREDYNFRNPSHVGLAYTDDEETGLPKEVYADLDGCRIVTTFNGVVVDEENFKSLDEMNVALDNLSFDDLVSLTEEQRIIGIKKTFDGLKVGDTVRGDGELWTITKITGDFSINFDNIDPNAQTSSQSVYGGWKELFAKRGFVRVSPEELEITQVAFDERGEDNFSVTQKYIFDNEGSCAATKDFALSTGATVSEISEKALKSGLYGIKVETWESRADEIKNFAAAQNAVNTQEWGVHQVVTVNDMSGADYKYDYRSLAEAVEAADGYENGTRQEMYGEFVKYDGAVVYNKDNLKIEHTVGEIDVRSLFSEEVLKANGIDIPENKAKTADLEQNITQDTLNFSFGNDEYFTESSLLADFANENPDMSFALGNAILEYLDKKQHSERIVNGLNAGWYDKTDFEIKAVIGGEEFGYNGRYDIGDGKGTGGGTLIEHIADFSRNVIKSETGLYDNDDKQTAQNTLDTLIPFLEINSVLTAEEQKIIDEFKEKNPIRTFADVKNVEPKPLTAEKRDDFYEFYGEDARLVAAALGLNVMSKNHRDMTDFPANKFGDYSERLAVYGYTLLDGAALAEERLKATTEKIKTAHEQEARYDAAFDRLLENTELDEKQRLFLERAKKTMEINGFMRFDEVFGAPAIRVAYGAPENVYKLFGGEEKFREIEGQIDAALRGSEKYTVEQTSDAFEEPFIIRNNDVSEDSPDRYYDIDGIYQTFETESEAQEYADKLNSTAEPALEKVSPVTQSSGDIISDFREKTDEYYNKLGGYSAQAIEDIVKYFIRGAIRENELSAEVGEVVLYGSRCRGMENENSDLDFVAEMYSDLKEDTLFNILHETPFEIGGVSVDINPIRAEESGTLEDYLLRAEQYMQQKGAKENKAPEVQDYRVEEIEQTSFGQKSRYAANVAAIRTLNQIESENRTATPNEQKILAQYVGWGGIPAVFDSDNAAWAAEYAELKELLTPDEYEAARSTVLTAHYTSPTIISAVYSALDKFGFKGGNVLEPSMGIGNFFGVMPEEMRSQSSLHGVELDDISGRIAKQLYPNADIQICGYENTAFSDNFFDAAVGNVPFGNYSVADTRYDREHFLIHDYFFGKTIDKVAPGGVIAFITSKGTLDKESPKVREYLAKRADLIGAIRLPNTAFKANAGTEVTADIIFLQKREKMSVEKPDWCYTAEIAEGISVNQYFVDHPEMILGEMRLVSGRYGYETACVPIEGAELKEQLADAVNRLRRDIITARRENKRNEEHGIIPATADVRNFTFTEVNDKIFFRENNIMREMPFSKRNHERMRGMIGIRNTFRAIVDAQSEGCTDETLSGLQFRLNAEYDAFVMNFGHISDIENRKVFAVDDDYNTLCGALELIEPETKTVTKADIFTKRTIKPYVEVTHVDTPQEALFVSLDMRGFADIDYMAELCGTPNEEVIRELTEGGFIYKNPETEKYEEAAEYLSGYVRDKLRKAQDAAVDNPEYERNVAALEKALPPKLGAGDISVRLGAPWITIADYCKFFKEYAQGIISDSSYYARDTVLYRSVSGEYKIENKNGDKSVAAQSSFGTKRMNSYAIFENLLNNRDIAVYDTFELPDGKKKRVMNKDETQLAQEKARQMKEAFPKWLWSDPERREKYVEIYNELFNSLVGREYDGSHQTFPGMNPFIELNEHQKNAVMRAKLGGNTLLAHCVGAGKTFEMAAAVMEKRRLGLINKACIVVPKHLVGQMSAEWLRLYPEARLLTAKENDFNDVNRQKFIGRCCTGDYDAVIMSYQQFQKIPMSFEYQREFLSEQLKSLTNQLRDYNGYLSADDKRSVKDLERMKKNVETKLKRLLDTPHDNSLNFEQLGFDCIVADEAHNYKNGLVVTKMKNVSGIGSKAAKKSEDFLMKTRYLNEKFGERNLVLASGTPVSNSMTELYIMQQYLRPSSLQRQGLQNFDDWASTFGEVVSQLELKPAGDGFRMKKRFAKFTNLPELMQAYKDFADIRTSEMLNLPVPEVEGGKPQVISAKPNEFQRAYMKVLAERSEAIHNGSVDPSVDNMLKITNEARLLGLDARTINPDADNYPNSKVNLLIEKVMEIYTETTEQKGVQAIFCDIAINDGKKDTNEIDIEIDDGESEKTLSAEEQAELLGASKFSVYKYVKEELIRRGVPENEICFAGDAKNQGQRGEMYAQLRAGTKRIVLASTTKMGTGANIQTRLCALHNLDIPWKPSDFEQRIGRIVRQGNNFPTVKIFNYVTEGTFDAYMLNLIVTKQKFISQLMSGKTPARTCEDVDELVLNYSEMQAIASGDPRIKEKIQLDTDVSRLRLLENEHLNKKYQLEDRVVFCQAQISIAKKQLTLARDDKEFAAKNILPEGEFKITLNGKIFTERKEAGAELRKAHMTFLSTKQAKEIGEYRGFKMSLNWGLISMNQYTVSVELSKPDKGLRYSTELELLNDIGNITRIENVLKLGIDKRISILQAELARNEKDLAEALRTKDAPFEYADELAQKSLRLAQLDAELGVGKKDEVIIDDENQDEDRGKGRDNSSPDQNKKPKRPKR